MVKLVEMINGNLKEILVNPNQVVYVRPSAQTFVDNNSGAPSDMTDVYINHGNGIKITVLGPAELVERKLSIATRELLKG